MIISNLSQPMVLDLKSGVITYQYAQTKGMRVGRNKVDRVALYTRQSRRHERCHGDVTFALSPR